MKQIITPEFVRVELTSRNVDFFDVGTLSSVPGMYTSTNEEGHILFVTDEEWVYYAIPMFGYADRVLNYYGNLTGDAAIVFFDGVDNVLGELRAPEGGVLYRGSVEIPGGTDTVYLPVKNPELVNFMASISDTPPVDATHGVSSWEDLEVTLTRDGTSGVFSEITLPLSFTSEAAEYLKALFNTDGIRGRACVNIYLRDNFLLQKYVLVKTIYLDFSTYAEYDERVEIDGIRSDLLELINAGARTEFDIPVEEVAETKKWHYERTSLLCGADYTVAYVEEPQEWTVIGTTNQIFFVFLNKAEMLIGTPEHEMKNQGAGTAVPPTHAGFFFRATEEVDIQLSIKGTYVLYSTNIGALMTPSLVLFRGDNIEWSLPGVLDADNNTYIFEVDTTIPLSMVADERLSFGVKISSTIAVVGNINASEFEECSIKLRYYAKSQSPKAISVISPQALLQRLIDEVSGEPGRFLCEINWEQLGYYPMLVSSETLTEVSAPNVHINIQKVMDFLEIMGYEYEVVGRRLIYRPRGYFYPKNTTAIELRDDEVADLVVKAEPQHAYTGVKIGYDISSLEGFNAKYELNGQLDYITQYKSTEENVLDMIMPFRADSVGIENLINTAGNSKDNTNKAMFIVALTEEQQFYATYLDMVLENSDNLLQLFNAPLHPSFLMLQNLSLAGIATDTLTLTGVDVDTARTGYIQHWDIYRNFSVHDRIFDPVVYNFATGSVRPLPGEGVRNGLVKFTYKGVERSGFIREIRKNYGVEQDMTWELWRKS